MAEPVYPTLSTVVGRIRKLLQPALDAREFWVRAELSSAKENRGNLYCDLVETKNDKVTVKIRCQVWRNELAMIRSTFEAQGLELALGDGTEVGIKCRVEFHEVYGLSLRGVDFDPNVALGALERRRREILERLSKDELLDVNARLPAPAPPNRIGVVASRNTAGCADFIETLRRCEFGVQVFLADARVQGNETEATCLRALDRLEQLDVGLVVILRGGGSRVDLSHLDNEAIARRIALYPVPVWTGIGHETDRSVLDEVAARSFKTPTAVAEEISAQLESAGRMLENATKSLRVAWHQCLHPARQMLQVRAALLARASDTAVRTRRSQFEARASHLRDASRGRLRGERLRVRATSREIQATSTGRLRVTIQLLEERRKSLQKTVVRFQDRQQLLLDHVATRLRSGPLSARLAAERRRLVTDRHSLTSVARRRLETTRRDLTVADSRFVSERYLSRLDVARDRHRNWERALRAADPQVALERGYSMTYDETGALVRSVAAVAPGTKLTTQLGDGTILSTVDGTKATKEQT